MYVTVEGKECTPVQMDGVFDPNKRKAQAEKTVEKYEKELSES